jgi:transposase InsO family protein
MPWKECSPVDLRREFVELARAPQANVAALCRRFGISRKTGYKWMGRFDSAGVEGLRDESRRPDRSPGRMAQDVEGRVLAIRGEHRTWGGRKIATRMKVLGCTHVPSPSAITRALHRHHLIDPAASYARRTPTRFEYPAPNDLWQMDFKGHFAMSGGGRCHPLTVLDDHSRFSLVLAACADERTETVRAHLATAFGRYGLPRRILSDNGSPWGTSGAAIEDQWTVLTVWLLRLGIGVIHGAPYHPQTQGKDERFHATLGNDLLRWQVIHDLDDARQHFEHFRQTYNHVRPHEALAMACPAQRYTISPRPYPGELPEVTYEAGALVRRVGPNGRFSLGAKYYAAGKAFAGHPVALRPTKRDGLREVYFCHQRIGWIDQHSGQTIGPRAGQSLAALAIDPPAV